MMMQHPVGILILLVLGAVAFVVTTVNLALPLGATLYFIRREKRPGRTGANFWIDVGIVVRTISYASAAHLIVICGSIFSNVVND